ncbi:hypothetical protein [uncultured Methanobrevibacter sp.]|nr:hypothetical protein [uncultured Methanobrevibacter sp.]
MAFKSHVSINILYARDDSFILISFLISALYDICISAAFSSIKIRF